jgi:ribosome-binding protein aMBF1 (putative translation factor)
LIVGGGSVLFTVWFSWYTVTKTIPDMQEKHAEFVKVMRKDFMDTILALEQRHEAYTGKSETEFRLDLAEILKLAREERDRSREDMAAYVKSRQDDQARFEAILERAGQQLGCKFVSGERHGA